MGGIFDKEVFNKRVRGAKNEWRVSGGGSGSAEIFL
jgi:hypothetical protein